MIIRKLFIPSLFVILFAVAAWSVTSSSPANAQPAKGGKNPSLKKKVTQVKNPKKHLPTDTVGIVNGQVITYHDFNSFMSDYLRIFVKRTGDNVVTDSLYSVIVDSAWDRAVNDILTEQEIEKRKIRMTDADAKQALLANPPEFIRQQFTDSAGTFHKEFMEQAFNDPRNDSIVSVIINGERLQMEMDRLLQSIDPDAKTEAERERAFTAWLRKAMAKAKIEDRRLSFGFY